MQFSKLKQYLLRQLSKNLSAKLAYHGLHHTLDVLAATEDLCKFECISNKHTKLLQTAALLHDAGFVEGLHQGHEAAGCDLARRILPSYAYAQDEIEQICAIIMATKIPQNPQNKLEEILCDADLDYLGRDDFYSIAHSLFVELHSYGFIHDEVGWNAIQVSFLEKHQYFTETNRRRREPNKKKRLEELRKLVHSNA